MPAEHETGRSCGDAVQCVAMRAPFVTPFLAGGGGGRAGELFQPPHWPNPPGPARIPISADQRVWPSQQLLSRAANLAASRATSRYAAHRANGGDGGGLCGAEPAETAAFLFVAAAAQPWARDGARNSSSSGDSPTAPAWLHAPLPQRSC
jgi:hypothetical protein